MWLIALFSFFFLVGILLFVLLFGDWFKTISILFSKKIKKIADSFGVPFLYSSSTRMGKTDPPGRSAYESLPSINNVDMDALQKYTWRTFSVRDPIAQHYIRQMSHVLVGMKEVCIGLWLSQMLQGHMLLEGLPGVAKTTAMKTHARIWGLHQARIQCTPDMLPADIIGIEMYRPQRGDFEVRIGPIMTNIFLVDEINRMPPKVQSALLEAMQEGHVSLGGSTHMLPSPFVVLATQNPQDQKGTYDLPEAQLDRFMCSVHMEYLTHKHEVSLLEKQNLVVGDSIHTIAPLFDTIEESKKKIAHIREAISAVSVPVYLYEYVVSLIGRTRGKQADGLLRYGCSPRTSIHIMRMAKALAHLHNVGQVQKEHVHYALVPVMRHRLVLHYRAQRARYTPDKVLAYLYRDIFAG